MKKAKYFYWGITFTTIAFCWVVLTYSKFYGFLLYEMAQISSNNLADKNIEIANYEEHPIIFSGLNTPIGLDVSFDIKQKIPYYFAADIRLAIPRSSLIICGTMNKGDMLNVGARIQGKTQVHAHFICVPESVVSFSEDRKKICVMAQRAAVPVALQGDMNIKLFLSSASASDRAIPDITAKLQHLFNSDSLLNNYGFWRSSIEQLQSGDLLGNGYVSCEKDHKYNAEECYCAH